MKNPHTLGAHDLFMIQQLFLSAMTSCLVIGEISCRRDKALHRRADQLMRELAALAKAYGPTPDQMAELKGELPTDG